MTNELWDRVSRTNPEFTKSFSRGGGFKGTAINATYLLKRLTEEFGPCGRGWRFVIESERIEEGHTLKNGDKAKVHIVCGHIEYLQEGQWYATGPQFGQTMLVDENKYGPFTDEEAPKKSITDCISKCAVLLGFGADIHLGLFDDNKYVNALKKELGEKSDPDAKAITAEEAKTIRALIDDAPDMDAAKFCAHFKIDAVPDLPQKRYQEALDGLNRRIEAGKKAQPKIREAAE